MDLTEPVHQIRDEFLSTSRQGLLQLLPDFLRYAPWYFPFEPSAGMKNADYLAKIGIGENRVVRPRRAKTIAEERRPTFQLPHPPVDLPGAFFGIHEAAIDELVPEH